MGPLSLYHKTGDSNDVSYVEATQYMTVRSSFDKSLNEVSFIATTYMKSDDSIINKWIFKTPIQ